MDHSDTRQLATSSEGPAPAHDEVLYKNERTLITRRKTAQGPIVIKQALGADAQTRLRHEASILERLTSVPGVVKLLPDQTAGALVFHDEGGIPLAQLLLTEKLTVDAIVRLAWALSHTLAAMHRVGVIHKDINPANILLVGAERRPVLIDFNIASCFAQERLGFVHQNHIAGTLAYMAPEQTGRTGRAVDQRSDLYALGVTLYELTVGHKPFESDDLLELIHDHLVRQPLAPALARPGVPLALSDIIMRLLEKEADQRYQSAEGLCHDLVRLRERLDQDQPAQSFPLGQDDFPLRLSPPSALIGRTEEIASLQEAIDGAARGEGRALLISGAPGVGKSALINELQPMVTARRGWFVTGKFEQYQRDTTSAFVQALRALGRLLLAEPQATLERHRMRILKALGANAGLGPSLLPEFAVLLGKLPRIKVDDPVEAESRMIQATVDMLKSVVSPEQPLVLVVDDLQWAPAVSLRFMDALMTHDKELQGLLIVGAYRGNEVDAAHPLSAMLARWAKLGVAPPIMELGNLPDQDLGQLIGNMLRLPDRDARRLGATLYERTQGNPYDTVELINALRHDGLLTPAQGNWHWNDAAIRQFVGDCDVVGLLGRRIDRLPQPAHELLEILACLGGEVTTSLLSLASGRDMDLMERQLAPALEDGLIVAHNSHENQIRFRHDRVQQATHERMLDQSSQSRVRLALARRLAAHPKLSALAAKQYLPAHEAIDDPVECHRVIELFQEASAINRVINYDLCERFLSAAIHLMSRIDLNAADRERLFKLQADRHAALYGLGRLDEADQVYDALVASQPAPMALVDMATVQIASLSNRSRHKDAVALGLGLLKELGLAQPEDIKTSIGMSLFKMATWIASPDKEQDLTRAEVTDPLILAMAKVLSKTQVAAYFCAAKIGSWLTMESHRLWVEHGPCPALMMTLSSTPIQLMAIAEDYEGAYTLSRHLLKVGEARHYEPATSVTRFLHAFWVSHWYEPLEEAVPMIRKAREGLFQAGDFQYGMFTYGLWTTLFEISPSIDGCLDEIKAAFGAAARLGDHNFLQMHRPAYQLYKALHGDMPPDSTPGSFNDAEFDEATHEASISAPPIAGSYFHVGRALSAAIFHDEAKLYQHACAAMPLLPRAIGNHIYSRTHLFYALALAQRLQSLSADSEERLPLLADLDKSLKWLKRRAKDAPANFHHLHLWLDAERAWAVGEHWAATTGFNNAMNAAAERTRPWHRALITERAARFHLSQGMEATGRPLIHAAQDLYAAWGAKAKVAQMADEFSFLRSRTARKSSAGSRSTIVSTDMVDVMSVLRASQALSSETSLDKLNKRVSKVLGAMTGAASVTMAVRSDEGDAWQVFAHEGDKTTKLSLDAAAQHRQLPLSVFQYAERMREPLLLAEATKDERFSRDPYFDGVKQCSMLLLPVISQGELKAMLLLENRLSRSAFSSDRLDAVSLIAGQLSVSLDNALLYASLEEKVAARTAELEEANKRLELLSSTDALTGVSNRRKFNEALDAEWLRAKRTKSPVGLVMIDIDHFKLYNDHYGHQGGDTCLQLVASLMRTGLRAGSDLIARYGGEEFVLLLPNTDLNGTFVVAERVRAAIEARREPHAKSTFGIVTISVGITSFVPTQDTRPTQFIEVADQALYEAKRGGRNRVVRSS